MKISFNTRLDPEKINQADGYGYATDRILASLNNLGYEVSINDPTADVGFVFDQPHKGHWYDGQYKILYHPWESTKLLPRGKMSEFTDWLEIMNSVDEVWTPSPLVASWYHDYAGVTRPVHVFQHGVDADMWSSVPRKVEDKMIFLHVGGQSARKGLTETLKGFRRAFPTNQDVELHLKIISKTWQVPKFARVHIFNDRWPVEQLVQKHHDAHVFLYPSWGEGFGLMPLQAMATGMPTITSRIWAPYANFLDANLSIGGAMVKTPWPSIHPGEMICPDLDEIIDRLRYSYNNYDSVHRYSQSIVPSIKAYYDWDTLTDDAFGALKNRLEK